MAPQILDDFTGEFGVKLNAKKQVLVMEGLNWGVLTFGKPLAAIRKAVHRVRMAADRRERRAQSLEQRALHRFGSQMDGAGVKLQSLRMAVDLASQKPGQNLMSIANPKNGDLSGFTDLEAMEQVQPGRVIAPGISG